MPQLYKPAIPLTPMAWNRTPWYLQGVLMTWTTSTYRPAILIDPGALADQERTNIDHSGRLAIVGNWLAEDPGLKMRNPPLNNLPGLVV